MTPSLGPLTECSRVVIIGGGPGGTACALALHRLARIKQRQLSITIVEGKQFTGERHYNQCAGVLSPPLSTVMRESLEVPFPTDLIRDEIQGYVLHTDLEQIYLPEHGEPSLAVRRVHFDAYMLDQVKQRGMDIVPARATDLEFLADRVIVYTENMPLECDVVVGAFGLDEGTAAIFSRLTPYRPPKFLASVVTKYHPEHEAIAAFGHNIQAFLFSDPHFEFGAVTPKGNHLTINIAGQSVDVPTMQAFLSHPLVQQVLPNLSLEGEQVRTDLRFFKGRFPRALAHGYYGDRYVLVGDSAGLVRAFKGKGITSAVQSGVRAAETMMEVGISYQAFHRHYRTANQDIIGDLPYGRLMRRLTILLSRYHLLDPFLRAARTNTDLQSALFGAVSGSFLYRDILFQMLRPRNIAAVLRALPRDEKELTVSPSLKIKG